MLTIATWNLQKLTPGSKKERKDPIKQKIQEINADIWIFTEVIRGNQLAADLLPDYHVTTSQEYKSIKAKGNADVMICSRFPHQEIRLESQTYETACVSLEVDSNRSLIVYGTIIPYKNYKVVSLKNLALGQPHIALWDEHKAAIAHQGNDWETLSQKYPNHALCVAGDFNQSRNNSGWYSIPEVEDLLTEQLDRSHLECITTKDFALKRQTVSHICISQGFAEIDRVSAWGNFAGEIEMSDHNGVVAELSIEGE